jgi:hypothetical protein
MLRLTAPVVLLALLGGAGCSDDPTSPSTARVSVRLTDAPIDLSTVNAVNVTLDRIILFGDAGMQSDEDGMEMDRPTVEDGEGLMLDLLDFQNGETVTIAVLDVPPGGYQKVRMYVREASLTMNDPTDPTLEIEVPIDVPSSKVDIPVSFEATGGVNTDVVLDFDAELSVQVNETLGGNKEYILRPVITPVGTTQH